ncbi:MAG TPA: ABC transporter permease [Rhizobiaceae bacterium]|nr:ABC transporter permease [Rhizobiaceae bacterium]
MSDLPIDALPATAPRPKRRGLGYFLRRHPTVAIGGGLLLIMVIVSVFAPLFTAYDPIRIDPGMRLKPPSAEHWFGTDQYGRDIFSRTLYGGRVSLLVGISVALVATLAGIVLGLLSGYVRMLDAVIMRTMDGLMAIPSILLAIAMMSIMRASITLIVIAIAITELPRVVRLVRSLVLGIREQTYVHAAIAIGNRTPRLLRRHILPNIIPPLIVQATFIFAVAVMIEATLSFLGVGTPPEIPSWGNIIAESRIFVMIAFWTILFPGLFLAIMVLAINILGDGLRDMLDPRLARRM